MTPNVPDHEKLFDEICGKLNELSRNRPEEEPVQQNQEKIDRLQSQIRRFQTELHGTQEELREKIKVLENVQVAHQGDLSQQLRQLTEQLNNERAINTKLNADLAKSLELGLQLQLEIQNLKARSQQVQHEERKFSQTLQEKIRQVSHDLELMKALREETETELNKARARFLNDQDAWNKERLEADGRLKGILSEKEDLLRANEELLSGLKNKDEEIASLSGELEKMSTAFGELEESSMQQTEVMKNLTGVAENKIVELKIALDRKTAECRDFEGHLQQAVTQNQLLRQENASLKDYIAKINVYLQASSAPVSTSASTSAPPPVGNA